MKKIIASAVGLMLAGGIAATSASAAIDNQFGGYWRTRFTYDDNMTGVDTPSRTYVDTRTHLYYTAKFSDDFKFVNKFEFNTGWGDATKVQTVKIKTGEKTNADGTTSPVFTSYDVSNGGNAAGGDMGADGRGNFRIKNSYADFNVGPMFNAKVGIQAATIARGFIFKDDFAGVMLTGKFGNVTVPLVWGNINNDEGVTFDGAQTSAFNQNILAALAAVKINDGMSVTPYFVYHSITDHATLLDSDNWYLGADVDMKFGSVGVWGFAIYNGGDINGLDNKGYLGAVGVDAGIVHGQFFYASGDDDATDGDNAQFISAPGTDAGLVGKSIGASYYWAEIMGHGVFDNQSSNGSPNEDVTNVWAGNVGVTIKPMDKLKVDVDVWYASLVEDNAAGDTALGLEFDGKVGYKLYDNLTAEAIFAYLVSDDATGDEDVMEGGVQLSLAF